MNTASYQRVSPLPAAKTSSTEKRKAWDETDRRRYEKLQSHWTLLKALGKSIKLTRLSRRAGRSSGRASQMLHGHEPLTIEWMMIFSEGFDCAPQDIWGDDWPFPDLTPTSGAAPHLAKLMRKWNSLPPKAQAAILKIIENK